VSILRKKAGRRKWGMGNKDKLAQNYEGIFSQLTTLKTFHINARNKCMG
jgi:hypothetical protein